MILISSVPALTIGRTMHYHHRPQRRLTGIAAVAATLAILLACFPSPALATEDVALPDEPAAIATEPASVAETEDVVAQAPDYEAAAADEATSAEAQPVADTPTEETETDVEPDEQTDATEAQELEEQEAEDTAATGISGSYLIETGTSESHVLAADSASEGAAVSPVTYSTRGANQVWDISYDSAAGAHRILLASSSGRLALATDDGARLFLAAIGTTDPKVSLLWALFAAGGDGYQIASVTYPDLCISSTASSSMARAEKRMFFSRISRPASAMDTA